MPRTHGYSLKGERCYGVQDWGARGRTNAIGALIDNKLLVISLFDQNVNTEVFNCWVDNQLIPNLPPKSVVVMDNASFHKSQTMQAKIHLAGHVLEYLPAYSPDLNQIEHKWAQAKSLRRKHSCDIDSLFKDFCT
jgi:hypothetical protein